ncbi:MAG: HPr family phosphocarrier protein [Eubacterium sp.]|nr:HPr family phosphocarrier protein [Eubacterium sp.]
MTTRDITIEVQNGVEVSPVAKCVQVASQFESKIYVERDTKRVNAKSIMGMMALGIVPGQTVSVSAEGEDEVQAIEGIANFLENK